jgi:glyoxylase-like metal-dependent hydrolase (beta-lactamase superfamily II)
MLLHDNTINLVSRKQEMKTFAQDALPVITYDQNMRMHFNGERIDLLHYGPAHTTGDTAVVFRTHNLVHMGDVYNNAGYPFIDVDNGGSLDGVIEFCTRVLEQIDARTIVVPGHGPVAAQKDLVDYVAMLTTLRERMTKLISSGATLEQVVAAQPTKDFDAKKGDPASFLNRAYASLKKR